MIQLFTKSLIKYTRLNLVKDYVVSTVRFAHESASKPSTDSDDLKGVELQHHDYFSVRHTFTMHDLFQARVHLGHKEGLRHEKMIPYILGSRLGVDIIDLRETLPRLQDALNFTAHIAYRGGIIVFFSRNLQNMPMIEQTAKDCGEYAHCRIWRGGIFTNAPTQFGNLTRLPDLCIFFNCLTNVFEQHTALRDSAKLSIPTIGIVDTNVDPSLVTFPVPGNDDSPVTTTLYCNLFKNAILSGKKRRDLDLQKGDEIALDDDSLDGDKQSIVT